MFDAPANGKARFTATPPVDAGNAFFMRVKVTSTGGLVAKRDVCYNSRKGKTE